ncbi:MAG TPA: protein-disulfide reductase DsbD domain-containing protein [Beijerinckiaceae bacterium]|jgi:DsbC/DsbD-like thiol-disulfide interchange protein
MTIPLRGPAAFLFLALLAVLIPGSVAAGGASPWIQGHHSRVRLMDGGARLAGIEIVLDTGFKTYWRTPGESGLPPAFDWAGSDNLAGAEVLWPAPQRLEDAGGVSYGYKDHVLLPVRVIPKESGKPVRLSLRLDYGVCKDICIPAQARLALDLEPGGGALRPAISEALARVPKPQPLGAPGDLSVLAVAPATAGGKPALAVEVAAPPGADLFVEGPDGWYLGAGPMRALPGAGKETGQFLVEIFERPRSAAGPLGLRFTLVSGERAVETAASLDIASLPR